MSEIDQSDHFSRAQEKIETCKGSRDLFWQALAKSAHLQDWNSSFDGVDATDLYSAHDLSALVDKSISELQRFHIVLDRKQAAAFLRFTTGNPTITWSSFERSSREKFYHGLFKNRPLGRNSKGAFVFTYSELFFIMNENGYTLQIDERFRNKSNERHN